MPERTMPHLIRFILTNVAIGFAAAIAFVGGLIAMDINGLRTLMLESDAGGVALAVLIFFTGLTFASAQVGIAVMRLSGAEENATKSKRGPNDRFPPDGPGGGTRAPIPVRIKSRD
jgi:TRAP-type C4-dicarboxylate transport system permease small subunit